MIVATAIIKIYISWADSLKEKRMVAKSIIEKVKRKYNVSIAEIEAQDNHKILIMGIAGVSNHRNHAELILDNVLRFIENNNTEAEIIEIIKEIR